MKKSIFNFLVMMVAVVSCAVCFVACGGGREDDFYRIVLPAMPAHVANMQCSSSVNNEPGAVAGSYGVTIYLELEEGWQLGTLRLYANGVELPFQEWGTAASYELPEINQDMIITCEGEAEPIMNTITFTVPQDTRRDSGRKNENGDPIYDTVAYDYDAFAEDYKAVMVELTVNGQLTKFKNIQEFVEYIQTNPSYAYGSTIQYAFYSNDGSSFYLPLLGNNGVAKVTTVKTDDFIKTLYTFRLFGDLNFDLWDRYILDTEFETFKLGIAGVDFDKGYNYQIKKNTNIYLMSKDKNNEGQFMELDWWHELRYKSGDAFVYRDDLEIYVGLANNAVLNELVDAAKAGKIQLKVNGVAMAPADLEITNNVEGMPALIINNVKFPWDYPDFDLMDSGYYVSFNTHYVISFDGVPQWIESEQADRYTRIENGFIVGAENMITVESSLYDHDVDFLKRAFLPSADYYHYYDNETSTEVYYVLNTTHIEFQVVAVWKVSTLKVVVYGQDDAVVGTVTINNIDPENNQYEPKFDEDGKITDGWSHPSGGANYAVWISLQVNIPFKDITKITVIHA